MTCEIAVMNKRGVALAADSAVTLGDRDKIYTSAEKLFQLAPSAPVGIMTCGGTCLMGVPWETVIAGYRRKLGDRRYDTLAEYCRDFIAFIEGTRWLFPESVQRDRLRQDAKGIWKTIYADPLARLMKDRRRKNGWDRNTLLLELIHNDHRKWQEYPPIETLDEDFVKTALAENASLLDEVEQEVFGVDDYPEEVRAGLRTTIGHFLGRGIFIDGEDSDLVIAGIGEAEAFPSLLHHRVGMIILNRLRHRCVDETAISQERDASVAPFAQREIIDMMIEGIHPDLDATLVSLVEQSFQPRRKAGTRTADKLKIQTDRFRDLLEAEKTKNHSDPFLGAVAALPRHDLASLAEALVNITAVRARASANVRETVAGPIDVALLSKNEGFVWVKRKRVAETS